MRCLCRRGYRNQPGGRRVQVGMDPEDREMWAEDGYDLDDPAVIERWHLVRWELLLLKRAADGW